MISAKHASLLAGVFQQTLLVLIIRYSRTLHTAGGDQDANGPPYLISVAVASSEVLKILLNGILEIINDPSGEKKSGISKLSLTRQSFGKKSFRVIKSLFSVGNRESVKLIVPAALYLLQNNLLFVALANLSVPMYQVTNQGKLLVTAIISRIVLKKHISGMQYLSIALLGFGVAVIHLSEYYENLNQQAQDASLPSTAGRAQNQWLGLVSVVISCFTSGFASVYFELILKTDKLKQSIHMKNFQLAIWSFLFATIHIACSKDLPLILTHGLFHGFDGVILMVVVAQSMSGFVASMMLHYADSILKGFAVSVAAVLATVLSMFVFGTKINGMFFPGASLVGIAVTMYSFYGKTNDRVASPYRSIAEEDVLPVRCMTLRQPGRKGRNVPFAALFMLKTFMSLGAVLFSFVSMHHFYTPLPTQTINQNPNYQRNIATNNGTVSVTQEEPIVDDTIVDDTIGLSDEIFKRKSTLESIQREESVPQPTNILHEDDFVQLMNEIDEFTEKLKEEAAFATPVPITKQSDNDDTSTTKSHKKENVENTIQQRQAPVPINTATIRETPETCHIRDISNYTVSKVGDLATKLERHLVDANCLFFNCSKDNSVEQCDNTLPTNYDGPSPPCCAHILRDISRIFDEEMCNLGLDYAAAFGTLLGLWRSDRHIPWTIDNDYIIPSKTVANAMVSLWDTTRTGLTHLHQGINRMCINPDFAGGKLQKWSIPPASHDTLWKGGFPYVDFYIGRNMTAGLHRVPRSVEDHPRLARIRAREPTMYGEFGKCRHHYHNMFPTRREFFYNGTLAQRIPANPDQILRTYYGRDWRKPKADKNPHGTIACPFGPDH